ncbi:MAG TPA: class I SAM-dependent methyltransferase [Thermoclostridium sp.]|nr:class I SAM-dependent methyltransferase [Thermoclostridium sp.]
MTAKVSCFARAYHYRNNTEWVFKDDIAGIILGEEDYLSIADNMAKGIQFFAPGFKGDASEALRFIADRHLSPSVLGRSAFCEKHLMNETAMGCRQYVLFAAGYDTFSFRNTSIELRVYELDLPDLINDKKRRADKYGLAYPDNALPLPCNLAGDDWISLLCGNGFQKTAKSFGSLLGISYYLLKDDFKKLINRISSVFAPGSVICLDYPAENDGVESRKNRQLADAAGEPMKSRYSYEEMEGLLQENGFLLYEHLDDIKMTEQYFMKYNMATPEHTMSAPKGINYLLAIKQ